MQSIYISSANETGYLTRQHLCLNFIFDTNGKKGPNAAGKDIGVITALYATDSSVAMAMPYKAQIGLRTQFSAIEYCKNMNARIPTLDEAISYYSSIYLYGFEDYITALIWTSITDENNSNNAWAIGGFYSAKYSRAKSNNNAHTACIK